jgi:hypothetical protein
LSALWRQLVILFVIAGGVALVSASVTTALYTRRFRLISKTLRRVEAGAPTTPDPATNNKATKSP